MKVTPKRDLADKPKVTIHLDPVLEAYCRYIFQTPPHQKEIVVSRHHDVGKLIHSNVTATDLPSKSPSFVNPVVLILPVNPCNQYAFSCHFLTVSNWGGQKIADGIEVDFKSWIRHRFESGYENKLEQKEIVESILRGLNLRNNSANFDTIKKIDYRNRRRIEEKRFKTLLCGCI